ncbi:MAG: cytochrome C biosynthesis protein [Bacteroidetes bacterium]|nr:MAG: cytochrome C biosynthesis protein [Bacteroidota bacterium]
MSTEEQSIENKGIQSISGFYNNNKNNVTIAGIALILVAAGIWYYGNVYKPELESEANKSFFMAERYFSTDSTNKALNGDGTNLGLIAIVDEFGSTKAGQQASYLAGRALMDQGKYDEALGYLEDVSLDDELLAAQVITLEGDCHSELGDYETAGDKYMKAANARENTMTTPYALLKAGKAYEEAGELNSALKAFEQLEKEYINSRQSSNVEAKIARVKAKIAAK